MSELFTKEDVRVASIALHAMWTSHPDECLDCKDDVEPVLEAVAPAIAAKALRDLADDIHATRIAVEDGGGSFIDLYLRADEIERGQS